MKRMQIEGREQLKGQQFGQGPCQWCNHDFFKASSIDNHCILKDYIDYFCTNINLLNNKVE